MRNGLPGSQPHPLGRVVVGAVAEGLLEAAVHRVQVDAEGGEQLGVAGLRAWQQVLGAEVTVPQAFGLQAAEVGHDAGLLGGGHHAGYLPGPGRARGPCFWCTACLLTPSRLAMSRQDQPLARALSTCRASSTSARPRRAATARRPISGSWLAVAAANVVTWLVVASSMASTYLDDSRQSMLLDDSNPFFVQRPVNLTGCFTNPYDRIAKLRSAVKQHDAPPNRRSPETLWWEAEATATPLSAASSGRPRPAARPRACRGRAARGARALNAAMVLAASWRRRLKRRSTLSWMCRRSAGTARRQVAWRRPRRVRSARPRGVAPGRGALLRRRR